MQKHHQQSSGAVIICCEEDNQVGMVGKCQETLPIRLDGHIAYSTIPTTSAREMGP